LNHWLRPGYLGLKALIRGAISERRNRRHDEAHLQNDFYWRRDMRASLFYRIAAVVLVLFGLGHTLGFRQNIPEWGAGPVIQTMQSVHFNAQGFNRTYWDFFSAFGFYFSIFLFFAAVFAWQLGSLPTETSAHVRGAAWALATSLAAVTALTWNYGFTTPLVFSVVATMCLILAAWLSGKKRLA
jgi:hypothetical protein